MNNDLLRSQLMGLHTALLCDVMDGLGFRDSAFGTSIRPMEPTQKLVGTAFTMRCEAVDRPPEKPYQHLLVAYADLTKGDVIVLHCGDQVSAMWGELLSTAAVAKGAVGAVMDGATRDVDQILQMDFPVFSTGFSPLDSAGRQEVVEHGAPVQCGNAHVQAGDWVVGDIMGVVVIPRHLVEQVVTLALAKDARESTVRDELLRGEEIGDVFARHGIL
jgi:4-hydroxy-4-methyl-2-oxoglutarate aldolase